jgi:hypothetical protein
MKTLSDDALKLRAWVQAYCSDERNPSLSAFEVLGTFDRTSIWDSPAVKLPGCYAIYADDGTLLYVGMSESRVGQRIGKHFSPAVQRSAFWSDRKPPFYIDIVLVGRHWEALSLEGYLKENQERVTPSTL